MQVNIFKTFLKHIAYKEGSKETLDDVLQFLNHNQDTLNSVSSQSIVKLLATNYFSPSVLSFLEALLVKSDDPNVTSEVLKNLSSNPKNDTQGVIETIKTELPKFSPIQKEDALIGLSYSFNCFDFIEKELKNLGPEHRSASLLNLAFRVKHNENMSASEKD